MPKQTQFKPKQTQFKPKQTQFKPKQTKFQCSITYYDRENTLVKCCEMAMIVHNVASTTFWPKGNRNSRSKYAFEVETIYFGGKPL